MKPRRLHIETLEGRELMAGDVPDIHDIAAETVLAPKIARAAKAPEYTVRLEGAVAAAAIPVAQGRTQFVLQGVNKQNIDSATLAKAEGNLALRITWAALEPVNGQYNWAFLDSQMARATKVQFILLAGQHDSPPWLKGLGVQYVDELALPWSTVMQAQYKELATAIASHLESKGTLHKLSHIYIPGAESAELHYKNVAGFYSHPKYSDDRLISGQMQFAHTLATAFPQSIVVSTLGDHKMAWAPKLIAQMKAELGGVIGFQMNSLSARTDEDYLGYTRVRDAAAEGHHAGFQTVSASTNTDRFGTGGYDAMYAKFLKTKATWLQDYKPDIR